MAGRVGQGTVWQAWLVGLGHDSTGEARQAGLGPELHGPSWRGRAWTGWARHGAAGVVWSGERGVVRHVLAGMVGSERQRRGLARWGLAWSGRRGRDRRGKALLVRAWRGLARQAW